MKDALRLHVLIACGLLIALLTGCGFGSPHLVGTLLDAEARQPVVGQVTVGEQVVTTHDRGSFRVDLELGDYQAVVRAPGYVGVVVPFSLTGSEKKYSLDLLLQPRLLEGRVLIADTAEPAAGASVAYGEAMYSTDAGGAISIPARDARDLTVSGPGLVPVTVPAAEVESMFVEDGSLVSPLQLTVTPRMLSGSVMEPDGTPVAGAGVRVGSASATTDQDGRYQLRYVEPGPPIIVTSAAHHSLPEAAYEGQAEYTAVLEPYVAKLQVSEYSTMRALEGVAVSAGGEQLGVTDASGVASLRVSPGSALLLSAFGYLTETVTYEGDADPIAVVLTPTLLQGVILDQDSQEPLANALVQIFRADDTEPELLRTDEQGRYAIPDATEVTRLFIKLAGYDRLDVAVEHLGQLDLSLRPFVAQGIYVPFGLLSLPDRIYELLDFVDRSPSLNAVVIDVKGDWAHIAWPSEMPVAQEIRAFVPGPMDMGEILAYAKERDIYTIARIVTFKDRVLAEGKPEWAIHTQSGALYLDGENLPWGDPFLTEVWDYNIGIALEAIGKGFDEVQFDYLRFPSEGRVSDRVYSQEANFETRTAAMAGFCAAAYAAIEPTPAFVSADIFGLTVWVDSSRDMGIGQRLDDIAAHMDYISPMLYPQTFNPANLQFLGISDVELYPYETLYYSLQKTLTRTGTKVRPWLQHYSGRYTYGLDELLRQRKGAEDGGATGWLFWNAKGSYLDDLFGPDPYSLMTVVPQPPEEEEE
ncbi:MAG: putative glycoside hydrolase [Anaerolineae bacterium]